MKGEIRDDIEPENVLAIYLALTTYWFQSRHVIQNFAGMLEMDQHRADAQYLEATIRVLMDGLHTKNEVP